MSKRGEMKKLKKRLRRTAKRIPLGATDLPRWLKRQFPTIYAQHVAYKMINGTKPIEPGIYHDTNGRGFQITEEMSKSDFHPNCKCKIEALFAK